MKTMVEVKILDYTMNMNYSNCSVYIYTFHFISLFSRYKYTQDYFFLFHSLICITASNFKWPSMLDLQVVPFNPLWVGIRKIRETFVKIHLCCINPRVTLQEKSEKKIHGEKQGNQHYVHLDNGSKDAVQLLKWNFTNSSFNFCFCDRLIKIY